MNHTAPKICIHADYGNPFKVHAGTENDPKIGETVLSMFERIKSLK